MKFTMRFCFAKPAASQFHFGEKIFLKTERATTFGPIRVCVRKFAKIWNRVGFAAARARRVSIQFGRSHSAGPVGLALEFELEFECELKFEFALELEWELELDFELKLELEIKLQSIGRAKINI